MNTISHNCLLLSFVQITPIQLICPLGYGLSQILLHHYDSTFIKRLCLRCTVPNSEDIAVCRFVGKAMNKWGRENVKYRAIL